MGSQSATATSRGAKACYSTFILTSIVLTISQLVCAPFAYARWYDPERGTFLSREPLLEHMPGLSGAPNLAVATNNPKAMHPYSFDLNDPVNFADPDGQNPGAIVIVGGLIVVGVVLYLGSQAVESGLEARLRAQCTVGCAAQTANDEYSRAKEPLPFPKYHKKPGAPKSCDSALCRAADAMKDNADAAARNLIRFWNESCAAPGNKI